MLGIGDHADGGGTMKSMSRTVALAVGLVLALTACPDKSEYGYTINSSGGGIGGGGGAIADPTVTLTAPTAPVAEGSDITITLALSRKNRTTPITVPFTVTAGTAGDFDIDIVTPSPITIPANALTAVITIHVVDDPFEEEPDVENFTLTLGSPSGATLGATTSATLAITDNDTDGLDNTISGRVLNAITGTPIAGVTVTGGGQTTTTNGNGHYSLAGPAAGPSVLLSYSAAGYAPQSRITQGMYSAEAAVILNVHMVPVGTSDTFDPTVAHVTTVPGSTAQVSFGANSLQTTPGGTAPTGNVTASVTPLLPGPDVSVMPGIYRAANASSFDPVETFGGLDVSVVDSLGNPLVLSPTQTADIRIPVSTRSAAAPPGAPLLYAFNAASGLWVTDVGAVLGGVAPAQYYDSTVTKLASFAANRTSTTVSVGGCVVDPTGSPVPDATVIAEGISYTGTTQVQTNAAGVFTIPTQSGQQAFIQAYKRTGISNAATVSGSATTLGTCLLLIPGAASIRLSWGMRPFDLDSHTMGPNANSHTRWSGKGNLLALPFVGLDVDDTSGFGPEITTISKAGKSRAYRFYVQNFSQTTTPGITGSPARVELYIKGEQTVFSPPLGETGSTITWHVFDMLTDANCDIVTVTPSAVPWQSQTESTLDDPANNPNPDNLATFCN